MSKVNPITLAALRRTGDLSDLLDRERLKINALLSAEFHNNSLRIVRYNAEHLSSRDRETLQREYSHLGAKLINPDAGDAAGYSNPADVLEFNYPLNA
jgi:hypothetical protein